MAQQTDYSDLVYAARCIADHAIRAGVLTSCVPYRPVYYHMGAVLADAALQAGLNYAKVVKPRVEFILDKFPQAATVNVLTKILQTEGSRTFLQWKHDEKISRFDSLVMFVAEAEIETTAELSEALRDHKFRADIRRLRGVGPKTVDYMGCLIGMDSVAVDRHIRGFAESVGLETDSYNYLRDVFSFAADLLSISRRDFDSSIWQYQAVKKARQQSFQFL